MEPVKNRVQFEQYCRANSYCWDYAIVGDEYANPQTQQAFRLFKSIYIIKAKGLWEIIDDIDTLSDAIDLSSEEGYRGFYDATIKLQSKRHKYFTSYDGYILVEPIKEKPKSS